MSPWGMQCLGLGRWSLMEKREVLQFKIDGFTPDTLPMERLAQYIGELSQLLAHTERVHFDKVRKGSAVLQAWVEPQVAPGVRDRIQKAGSPDAPADISRAYRNLNRMLRENNASGVLKKEKGATIIKFPGKNSPPIQTFRVVEASAIDGIIIRVGGIDESVPIWVQDRAGDVHKNCHTRNRSTAKELAKYYLGPIVRIVGTGKWLRGDDEAWQLDEFTVDSFEPLTDSVLAESAEAVRRIKGNAWDHIEDPTGEVKRLREG